MFRTRTCIYTLEFEHGVFFTVHAKANWLEKELWRGHSLISALCARALHWPGVYSVKKPPDEWENMDAIIENNYLNMKNRDIEEAEKKGPEAVAAVEAGFCVFLSDVLLLPDVCLLRA